MNNSIPNPIKIYHIVHIDKLPFILRDGCLLSDTELQRHNPEGTIIGMGKIKKRRMEELTLSSCPKLHVGNCVPFYFCPRSVMLYMFYKGNHPEISYRGGQEPIIHLVADMHQTILWAARNNLHCAFTTSNAGSCYFNDYTDENDLNKINWTAVNAPVWKDYREEKQAEFLIEQRFPWELVEGIGVYSEGQNQQVNAIMANARHCPPIAIKREWYY